MSNLVANIKSVYLGELLQSAENNEPAGGTKGTIGLSLYVTGSSCSKTKVEKTIDLSTYETGSLDLHVETGGRKSTDLEKLMGNSGINVLVPDTAESWVIEHNCQICSESFGTIEAEQGEIK